MSCIIGMVKNYVFESVLKNDKSYHLKVITKSHQYFFNEIIAVKFKHHFHDKNHVIIIFLPIFFMLAASCLPALKRMRLFSFPAPQQRGCLFEFY